MPDAEDRRNLLSEGVLFLRGGELEKALERFRRVIDGASDPDLLATALRHAADVHRTRCEWERAVDAARRSARVAEGAGLPVLYAEALNAEALVRQSQGDFARAEDLHEKVLELTDDLRLRGIALQNLGTIAALNEDLETAETRFRRSYACFKEVGYTRGEAIALVNQGRAALEGGRVEAAVTVLEEAAGLAMRLNDLELVALAQLNWAEALKEMGDYEAAERAASIALGFFTKVKNAWRRVECFRVMGDVMAERGKREVARRSYRRGLEEAREIDAAVEVRKLEERLARISETLHPDRIRHTSS